MKRRDFLFKTSVAFLGLSLLPHTMACTAVPSQPSVLTVKEGDFVIIRGNVGRYLNRGGTVGVFETRAGFIIVDSQFSDAIQPLIDAIRATGKPIVYLCNTHHHGDHTGGNIAFKEITNKIIAHSKVPSLQKRQALERQNEDQQLYPNVLFDVQKSIRLGGEKVTAYHFGAGHTAGDAIYHFETDNVVHMGDLMFNKLVPVYRSADGADSESWIQVLDKVLATFNDDTLFIFGHGAKAEDAVGTKKQITDMRNFLVATNRFVEENMAQGKSVDIILKEHHYIPGFENRMSEDRLPQLIKNIYEQKKIK